MNQIITLINNSNNNNNNYSNNNNINHNTSFENNDYNKKYSNYNLKIYKNLFIFTLIVIILSFILYLFIIYNSFRKEKISKNLMNGFNITTLYSNSSNYSTQKVNNETSSFVIGVIEIDKINICYPILSTTSQELLEISACRFAGPMPNEEGNLCIAGHNYANNKIFGKLNLLKLEDSLKIYDMSGKYLEYSLYNKYEVPFDNISCTNQNTNGEKLVTLITCNTFNGNRVIYNFKEKK